MVIRLKHSQVMAMTAKSITYDLLMVSSVKFLWKPISIDTFANIIGGALSNIALQELLVSFCWCQDRMTLKRVMMKYTYMWCNQTWRWCICSHSRFPGCWRAAPWLPPWPKTWWSPPPIQSLHNLEMQITTMPHYSQRKALDDHHAGPSCSNPTGYLLLQPKCYFQVKKKKIRKKLNSN